MYAYSLSNSTERYYPKVYIGTPVTTANRWNYDDSISPKIPDDNSSKIGWPQAFQDPQKGEAKKNTIILFIYTINMCTCIKWSSNGKCYFGRTLDNSIGFNQKIVLTPRNYPIKLSSTEIIHNHYSVLGTATVIDNYPLYADGINEFGLCATGLRFTDCAKYFPKKDYKNNVSPYEFILYVLATCKDICDVKNKLSNMSLVDIPFSDNLPLADLHWMIADKKECIVVESTKEGLNVYDNMFNVLTNNPPFPFHSENIKLYLSLTPKHPFNKFYNLPNLSPFCEGVGSIFLPGDYSSPSRFIRATFLLSNSIQFEDDNNSILQFFKILNSVTLIKGAVYTKEELCHYTIYTSCMDMTNLTYCYRTYENSSIHYISLKKENIDTSKLKIYEFNYTTDIFIDN